MVVFVEGVADAPFFKHGAVLLNATIELRGSSLERGVVHTNPRWKRYCLCKCLVKIF